MASARASDPELDKAIALAGIAGPYENWAGSGVLATPYDRKYEHTADFRDWGLARAVAEILNAVRDGRLVLSHRQAEFNGDRT